MSYRNISLAHAPGRNRLERVLVTGELLRQLKLRDDLLDTGPPKMARRPSYGAPSLEVQLLQCMSTFDLITLMQVKELSSVNTFFAAEFNVLHTWDSLKAFLTPLFSLEIYCFMWVCDYWMKGLTTLMDKPGPQEWTTNQIIEKRYKVVRMVAKVHKLHRFFINEPIDVTLNDTVESLVYRCEMIIKRLEALIPSTDGLRWYGRRWGEVSDDKINEMTMLSLSGVIELAYRYTQSAVLTIPFSNVTLNPNMLELIRPKDHEQYILQVAIHCGLLPELTTVQINSTTIDDGLITTIVSMPNLQTLKLINMKNGDECMVGFSSELSPNSMTLLTRLNMRDNQICKDGMNAFVTAINQGTLANLKNLSLSNNIIGDEGMNALSGIGTDARASLTHLWLDNNLIGDDGMSDFSSWLTWSVDESIWLKKLTLLDLSDNEIGQTGMKEFSTALMSNALANLEVLELSNNRIDDVGVEYFCEAASQTGILSNLVELYLNRNPIRGSGMRDLSLLLSQEINLTSLKVLQVLGEDVPFDTGQEELKTQCENREIDTSGVEF